MIDNKEKRKLLNDAVWHLNEAFRSLKHVYKSESNEIIKDRIFRMCEALEVDIKEVPRISKLLEDS